MLTLREQVEDLKRFENVCRSLGTQDALRSAPFEFVNRFLGNTSVEGRWYDLPREQWKDFATWSAVWAMAPSIAIMTDRQKWASLTRLAPLTSIDNILSSSKMDGHPCPAIELEYDDLDPKAMTLAGADILKFGTVWWHDNPFPAEGCKYTPNLLKIVSSLSGERSRHLLDFALESYLAGDA